MITLPKNMSVISQPQPKVRQWEQIMWSQQSEETLKGLWWSKWKHQPSQNTKLLKTLSSQKHQASQNTKQVIGQCESIRKAKVSGKMRWEQEQKITQSKWKNNTKQVDQDQPNDQGSQRPPKCREEGCCKIHQLIKTLTEGDQKRCSEVHLTPNTPCQWAIDMMKLLTEEQVFKTGKITMSIQSSPIDKLKPTKRQSTKVRTTKSKEMAISTKILLIRSVKSSVTHEPGKDHHLRETYVLGVYENESTHNWPIELAITDGYEKCRLRKLPIMPSH